MEAVIPTLVKLDKVQLDMLNTEDNRNGYRWATGATAPMLHHEGLFVQNMEVTESCLRDHIPTDNTWDFGWYVGRLQRLRELKEAQ